MLHCMVYEKCGHYRLWNSSCKPFFLTMDILTQYTTGHCALISCKNLAPPIIILLQTYLAVSSPEVEVEVLVRRAVSSSSWLSNKLTSLRRICREHKTQLALQQKGHFEVRTISCDQHNNIIMRSRTISCDQHNYYEIKTVSQLRACSFIWRCIIHKSWYCYKPKSCYKLNSAGGKSKFSYVSRLVYRTPYRAPHED